MRWLGAAIGLALLGVGGCASTSEDRVREYNEDGLQLYRQGAYDKAAESFEAAIALEPSDPTLLFNAARCYDKSGNATKAEQYYNTCLQKAPNDAGCRNGLASLMLRQGRRDDAMHMVEGWLAGQPQLAAAHTAHGILLHQFGDLPAAKLRLEEARRLDSHDTRALVELGQVWEALGAGSRLDCYERALDDNPHLDDVAARCINFSARGQAAAAGLTQSPQRKRGLQDTLAYAEGSDSSNKAVRPTHRPTIAIRHDAMKLFRRPLEHQWQKVTISLPQRQIEDAIHRDPFERAFRISR